MSCKMLKKLPCLRCLHGVEDVTVPVLQVFIALCCAEEIGLFPRVVETTLLGPSVEKCGQQLVRKEIGENTRDQADGHTA